MWRETGAWSVGATPNSLPFMILMVVLKEPHPADLAENGQKVWHILDFWHACEHLARIGRLLYGEGSERFKECFKRWRRMLRESRGAEVIEELTKLRDSGEYPTLRADLQGEIDYFTANQQRDGLPPLP